MKTIASQGQIHAAIPSCSRLLFSCVLLFAFLSSLAITTSVAGLTTGTAGQANPPAAARYAQRFQQCDTPKRMIEAWFLYGHTVQSPFHFPPLSSAHYDSLSPRHEDSQITTTRTTGNPYAGDYSVTKSPMQLTASLHAFVQFRQRCNLALAHIRASNSSGILTATDQAMEEMCLEARDISAWTLGLGAGTGTEATTIEPLLLLGSWYILRQNFSAAHETLSLATSREQANITARWSVGAEWEVPNNRTEVDAQRLILLSWTRYHLGYFDELDSLYPEMKENHFHVGKWMTLLQDRIIHGDLLRWQERMSTMQISNAQQMLSLWKVYCHQDSISPQQSCQELTKVVQLAGIPNDITVIDTVPQPRDDAVTDEQLATEFPNLLAFVQQQSGQPERAYEFEPITPPLDAASLNAARTKALRSYYDALLDFQSSESASNANQFALIVFNPAMRFTSVWDEHSAEFLNHMPSPSEFDLAFLDMDTLVLPQCAKMGAKGQKYWAQVLPGSIALKVNALLVTRSGATKLLLRRPAENDQQNLTADAIFTNPPFHCHFGHEFTPADFVVLYPIHPILMESYSPTPLTELLPSGDRNGDGMLDKRDVRVRLVLSKCALKPNQTEIDIMNRLKSSKEYHLKGSPAHPSTYRENPNAGAHWYSIHSADEAALCLTENWSMGSPRWLRWSDQCAEVGVDFFWIIRSVHPPNQSNDTTSSPPQPFDPQRKEAQYVTLEGSRGSFLFVQASTSTGESIDPFLRMRELLHSPPHPPHKHAPPECSVFRIEKGQIFTCFNTSLLSHPFYHELDEMDKPVLMVNNAVVRNFSRTIIPAIHMTEVAAKHRVASTQFATVRFTPVLNPRKVEASVAHSYAQLPVRRIIWAMWTQGPSSWPRLMKYNALSWHAVLNGEDSSNATNRVGTDYLGLNSSASDPNRWEIRILNLEKDHEDHLFNYVPKELLPPRFMELSATNQADVARHLLLLLYGGIWLDISILLLKPPEWLRSDGPGIWNSFYIDDRYHSMPHAAEYFQGLELWGTGSGVDSYIVEQNFLAQARTMMDLPRSTAIWLHPTMRNIDFTVMNGDYNYFRMNMLMVKCLQDDPVTRALFVSHGNVRDARSRTGGYHWLSPFIGLWLNETNQDFRWDFEGAVKLLTDPEVHAQDKQRWVKDIVQNDHMIEIPTGMAWSFREAAVSTSKTNLGYIVRQPLQLRRQAMYKQAEAKRRLSSPQKKP